ncbi:hypothetical protein P389DRAFT_63672 [Cystobasidium minutum MCA 4210]|uniref:uncharacterized protein n=1 Tax=Cystobasidium minutum MCA 4210 TaxID=1397322 RepID=UPI0034CDF498|eukprot:jgi/Rhomi1/63672/CE63671_411
MPNNKPSALAPQTSKHKVTKSETSTTAAGTVGDTKVPLRRSGRLLAKAQKAQKEASKNSAIASGSTATSATPRLRETGNQTAASAPTQLRPLPPKIKGALRRTTESVARQVAAHLIMHGTDPTLEQMESMASTSAQKYFKPALQQANNASGSQ